MPFQVKVSVYNSAGELVKVIFDGSAQVLPGSLSLDKSTLAGGADSVSIALPGSLYDKALGGSVSAITWTGDSSAGQLVNSGTYYIKADIVDAFGQVTTLQTSVQVIKAVTQNELNIYNSAGELVVRLPLPPDGNSLFAGLRLPSDSFGAKYDASTGAATSFFTVMVTDEQGHEFTVNWDGRNAQGLPVASGSYTAQLVYTAPGVGSAHVVESKGFIVLQSGNAASLAGSYACPNPSLHGADIVVHYPAAPPYSGGAQLYTLSGAHVGQAQDPGNSGLLSFSTQGLASGVYLIRVEKLSGGAVAGSTTIKVAVVR